MTADMRRHGFTLIEVAVASTLIAFAVLSALAIIPQGLQAQQRARMKAVASAAVLTLFATTPGWDGTTQPSDFTITVPPTLAATTASAYLMGTEDTLPETPSIGTVFYRWVPPVPSATDLANHIGFTFRGTGGEQVHTIRAWEWRPDPASGTIKAYYLTSFTYFLP